MVIDIHAHNTLSGTDILIKTESYNGVKKIVLLGDVLRFGAYPTEEHVHEINNCTIKNVEKFSDKCLGFCFLNPAKGAAVI